MHFRINVPLEQFELGAPELRGFKATGFPGGNLPKSGPGAGEPAGKRRRCRVHPVVLAPAAVHSLHDRKPSIPCSTGPELAMRPPAAAAAAAAAHRRPTTPPSPNAPPPVDAQQQEDCEILGNCDELELEAAIR